MRGRGLWLGVLILLLAGAVRFIGITHGQPNPADFPSLSAKNLIHEQTPLHPDEYLFVSIPLEMKVTGNLRHQFYDTPSFLINLNYALYWMTGTGNERSAVDWTGYNRRYYAGFPLYVMSRTIATMAGVFAVAVTMAVTRQVFRERISVLVSGGLVAVSFTLVQHSHYGTTNQLALAFGMLSVWASFRAMQKCDWRWLMLSGIALGFAVGNRYNAGLFGLFLLVAGIRLLANTRDLLTGIRVLIAWVIFPLAFLLSTPGALIDFDAFLADVRFISNQYLMGEGGFATVSPFYGLALEWHYLMTFSIGLPALLLAVLGIIRWLREHNLFGGLLLIYIFIYSLIILRTVRPNGADQLLILLIPSVGIFVGGGVGWLARWFKRPWLTVGLFPLIIAIPLSLSTQLIIQFVQDDSRQSALDWINANLPNSAFVYLIGPYNVPLDSDNFESTQVFQEEDSLAEIAESYDYLIFSDARQHNILRFTEGYGEDTIQSLEDYYAEIENAFTLVFEVERPLWAGYDWTLHTASYWHNPTIRVYCLHEASCFAVR